MNLRTIRDDDAAAIAELWREEAIEFGDEGVATADDVRRSWTSPRFDRDRHARVAELDGEIVGVVGVRFEDDEARANGFVRKTDRGRGIGSTLLRWAIESARAEPGITHIQTWAGTHVTESVELIAALGFRAERTFIRMRNEDPGATPPPEWPDGITVEPLTGDALIDASLEAYNGSFVDHWNFHPATRDEFEHALEDPTTTPELWFIAMSGDRIAGLCLNEVDRRTSVPRGDLGPIGTTRPFRGIGLGRALLRHSLRALADAGAVTVDLGVDTNNPHGALGLYERNGFCTFREGRVYRLDF